MHIMSAPGRGRAQPILPRYSRAAGVYPPKSQGRRGVLNFPHTSQRIKLMKKPNEGLPATACKETHDLISSLPLELGMSPLRLRMYQGLWIPEIFMAGVINAERHFKARHTDILLSSYPKCGTTWLKALAFSTITRTQHSFACHPLHDLSPHDCVMFLEEQAYDHKILSEINATNAPRLLSTHMPFHLLPESIKTSDCRMVYICRDPKDAVVSWFHFSRQILDITATGEATPLTRILDMFCEGIFPFGPIWGHALGYWNESLRAPERVLFLKYEEMLEDPVGKLTRLAEFMRCPFTEEEITLGVPGEIASLCSFENMRGLAVKQNQRVGALQIMKTESFYRKGVAGDWKNHLSPEIAQKLDEITQDKLQETGLTLGIPSSDITTMDA